MSAVITALSPYPNGPTDNTMAELIFDGTIALSGSYTTHGDTLSFLGVSDSIKSDYPPVFVEVIETPPAGSSASGYNYIFSPGSTMANGTLQIFQGGSELAAGAYPGGLTGATIHVRAWFQNV